MSKGEDMIGDNLDILAGDDGQKYVRFTGKSAVYLLESNYTFEVDGTWLQVVKSEGENIAAPLE